MLELHARNDDDDDITALWLYWLQALCAVLEYEICDNNDVKMQIITTLQSTSRGKRMYADLCERQIQLRELVRMSHFLLY